MSWKRVGMDAEMSCAPHASEDALGQTRPNKLLANDEQQSEWYTLRIIRRM